MAGGALRQVDARDARGERGLSALVEHRDERLRGGGGAEESAVAAQMEAGAMIRESRTWRRRRRTARREHGCWGACLR